MKLEFSRHTVEKLSNIKYNKNPFCGRRFFSMRTDRRLDEWIYTTKLIVAFRNFPNET